MIIDSQHEFSNAQSIVGDAATAINSTKYIDLGSARDAGVGEDVWLVIQIQTTVLAAGGAANVTFQLLEDTQADMASGSAKSLYTSGAIAKATLIAGYRVCAIKLPRNTKRYLRCTYTPDTNNTTAGKVDAFITKDPDANTPYASGFSIS
jgi:hypothetical protein